MQVAQYNNRLRSPSLETLSTEPKYHRRRLHKLWLLNVDVIPRMSICCCPYLRIIKGLLVFEGGATFIMNDVSTDDLNAGYGGAISNAAPGTILFEGSLTMKDNEAYVSFLLVWFANF